jgi:hypothetical protein
MRERMAGHTLHHRPFHRRIHGSLLQRLASPTEDAVVFRYLAVMHRFRDYFIVRGFDHPRHAYISAVWVFWLLLQVTIRSDIGLKILVI